MSRRISKNFSRVAAASLACLLGSMPGRAIGPVQAPDPSSGAGPSFVRVAAPSAKTVAALQQKLQSMKTPKKRGGAKGKPSSSCATYEANMSSSSATAEKNNKRYQGEYNRWVRDGCAHKPMNSMCKAYVAEMSDAETAVNANYNSWRTSFDKWSSECK